MEVLAAQVKYFAAKQGVRSVSATETMSALETVPLDAMPNDTLISKFSWKKLAPNMKEVAYVNSELAKDCVQAHAQIAFPRFEAYLKKHYRTRVRATYFDSHLRGGPGQAKPDGIHHLIGRTPTPLNTLFLQELKKRRVLSEFTEAQKLHAVGLAQSLLKNDPLRQFVYIFLSDLHFIQIIKVWSDLRRIEEDGVELLNGAGGNKLAALYLPSDDQLGINSRLTEQHFGRLAAEYYSILGQGSMATVLSSTLDKVPCVVKYFNKAGQVKEEYDLIMALLNAIHSLELDPELKARVLSLLPDKNKGVVLSRQRQAILFFKVGETDVVFDPERFALLVDFLHVLHTVGFVHRDFGPHNLVTYCDATGTVILPIDYGSLCRTGQELPYHGTSQHASDAVCAQILAGKTLVIVSASDDLHTFVRTVREFVSLDRAYFRAERNHACSKDGQTNYGGVMDFWKEKLSGDWWEPLVQCADNADYDGIKHFIVNTMNIK